jgi:7-cyano-7-deazaguanine synthase
MNPEAVHLTIDYGQRHYVELRSATAVAEHYRVERIVVNAPISELASTSALTGTEGPLVGAPTVVPGRNTVLIALAASLAESRGGGTVLIGVNADDHADYPDCRPEFIDAINALVQLSTNGKVTVSAPLLHLTKPEIGALARALKVPVEITWSCYAGGGVPCLAWGVACTRSPSSLNSRQLTT